MNGIDTICAPATSVGGGAVSIIRVSGPDALRIVSGLVRLRAGSLQDLPGFSLRFGEVPGVDEVLVSLFRAPRSYTGEDSCEISCHASPFVVQRILDLLCEAGCRLAEPGEYTRRAYLNGKLDLAQAEAVADLIAASTRTAHQIALGQLKGGYSAELRALRDQLLELASLLELELDFSEEELAFADRNHLQSLLDETMAKVRHLADSFQTGNAIRNGVPVAIVGPVNAGKSTLLNALLGDERAIVSPIPGTTRDTVEECIVLDGVQYRFIDTAGLRETGDSIEQQGIERSMAALGKALIILGVIDGSEPGNAQLAAWSRLKTLCRTAAPDGILIPLRNKTDICCERIPLAGTLDLSARTGQGMQTLRTRISEAFGGRCAPTGSPAGTTSGTDAARTAGFGIDAGSILVTNRRHYEALRAALAALQNVRISLQAGLSTELLAEDLRAAISGLGTIFGESITPDEILGEIFGRFCIGK